MSRKLAFSGILLGLSGVLHAGDWPAFRGPHGNGTTNEPGTPIHWTQEENVAWRVPLSRPGNGSPIVVSGRALITMAEDDAGRQRSLLCFDAATGKELWRKTESVDTTFPTHKTNPYGGTTPASDGQRVFVWHASAGLFAYDLEGKKLWSQQLGEFRHMWGYGTSPILADGKVILHTGPGAKVFIIAFDAATGKKLWTHEEPIAGNGETNLQGKYMGSWATPVLLSQEGQLRVVCSMATRVICLEVATGDVVWSCDGIAGPKGDLAYSSPLCADNLCVAMAGFNGPAMAFRLQGQGNITETARLWRKESANPQSIGSGLLIAGKVYRPSAGPNLLECLDAMTGEVIWQDRTQGGAFWGSISFNGKLAYVTDQQGRTFVFEPSPEKLDIIAVNELNEPTNATPALFDNSLVIRTDKSLWRIGK